MKKQQVYIMIMRWDWRILNASPHDFGGQCHEAQKLVTKWRHASPQQGFHCAQVQSCRSSAALTELRQRESKGCPTQKDCEGRTSNISHHIILHYIPFYSHVDSFTPIPEVLLGAQHPSSNRPAFSSFCCKFLKKSPKRSSHSCAKLVERLVV